MTRISSLFLLFFISCSPPPKKEIPLYLNVELKSLDGKIYKIGDLKRPLVLDFWASWCEPCKDAVPIVNRLYKELDPKKITFYGINTDSPDKARIEKAIQEFGILYPSLLDPELKLVKSLEVIGQPGIIILNKEGEIYFSHYGLKPKDYTLLLGKLRKIME